MMDAVKRRIYLAIVTVSLLVIAAIAYQFTVTGTTERIEDGLVARDFAAGLQLISPRAMQGRWANEYSIEKK